MKIEVNISVIGTTKTSHLILHSLFRDDILKGFSFSGSPEPPVIHSSDSWGVVQLASHTAGGVTDVLDRCENN